jgi:cytochrome c peroxidase
MLRFRRALTGVAVALAMVVAGCGGGSGSSASSAAPVAMSQAATLGETMFHDVQLSASGKQSCGTCHDKSYAFAGNPATDNGLPVPIGGAAFDLTGLRNAPSLMYASFTPPFDPNNIVGGFFRDGRASSLAVQAEQPLTTVFEMGNKDAAEVVQRLQTRPYLADFVALYGAAALNDPQTALQDIGKAIAAYESEDPDFHPFSSKFDFYQQGQAQLSAQELNGLALFNNPGKGNCTACHPSQRQGFAQNPLFTDFSYDNIGIPRNWNIPANSPNPVSPIDGTPENYVVLPTNVPADSEYAYYDLGLCGTLQSAPDDPHPRPDFSTTTSLCGQFKVPTLRNIAVTAPYFHNGIFNTLKEVVEWYVTRDINSNQGNNPIPESNPYSPAYLGTDTFYIAADGTPDQFQYNDLPVDFDANVNIVEVPYTPPTFQGGQAPTLTEAEIEDVVAFLCTLTDGFDPANPGAYVLPAQCQAQTSIASATSAVASASH